MKIFAGSELVTYDLALLLKQLGIEVTIAAFITGKPVSELCEKNDINLVNIVDEASKLVGKNFDLLWGHHWPVWGLCVNELRVKYRYFICSSLSPFVPLEAIPHVAFIADKVLLNSKENFNLLSQIPVNPLLEKSTIFLNSLADNWFNDKEKTNFCDTKAKNILVISNHIPQEIYDSEEYLKAAGIGLTYVGHQHEQIYISPDSINEFIAIITIGHSVQKAMSRGVRVYCYDHFGGPGWINEDNFDNAQDFNFSGRCCNRRLSSKEIAIEIINELECPTINVDQMAEMAFSRYSLSRNILSLLKSMEKKPSNYVNYPKHDDFFRKATQQYCNQSFKFGISPQINLNLSSKILTTSIDYLEKSHLLLLFRIDQGIKNIIFNSGQSFSIGGVVLSCEKNDIVTDIVATDNLGESYNPLLIWKESPGLYRNYKDSPNSGNARFSIKFDKVPSVKYIDIILKTSSQNEIRVCRVTLQEL